MPDTRVRPEVQSVDGPAVQRGEGVFREGLTNSLANFFVFDRSYRKQNAPMLMWSLSDPANPIVFWINPSETQWRIATRTSIEQINGGAVHHEWRSIGIGSQAPQKFDQPVVNFSFQSGLILPNATVDVVSSDTSLRTQRRMPQGVGNFYDFLELLNKPNALNSGAPNYVVIEYSSTLFPRLQLQGFFSAEGVQWTENAENPGMVQGWGASFIVFKSYPDLFNGGALQRQYIDFAAFKG